MVWTRVVFGTAPMTVSILEPSLKNMTVGILLIPYSAATPGLSSVFSLNCRIKLYFSTDMHGLQSANNHDAAWPCSVTETASRQSYWRGVVSGSSWHKHAVQQPDKLSWIETNTPRQDGFRQTCILQGTRYLRGQGATYTYSMHHWFQTAKSWSPWEIKNQCLPLSTCPQTPERVHQQSEQSCGRAHTMVPRNPLGLEHQIPGPIAWRSRHLLVQLNKIANVRGSICPMYQEIPIDLARHAQQDFWSLNIS